MNGIEVIRHQWEDAYSFHEGLAPVKDIVYGKYGYIDKNGCIIIPCQWGYAGDFINGIACVRDNINNKWGYIDKSARVVLWKTE